MCNKTVKDDIDHEFTDDGLERNPVFPECHSEEAAHCGDKVTAHGRNVKLDIKHTVDQSYNGVGAYAIYQKTRIAYAETDANTQPTIAESMMLAPMEKSNIPITKTK